MSNNERMFCYAWYEVDKPNETKFGERWVFDGQDPRSEIWKRIRSSLGVRKDIMQGGHQTDEQRGAVVLEKVWDVSQYAQKVDRFYKQARVDDHIREYVGQRKGKTGEVHKLPASELVARVNRILAKAGQPLPYANLSTAQYLATDEIVRAVQDGHSTILAELCARFGKTVWAGAVAKETGAQLLVVATYVLTATSSFKKDLSSFQQFANWVHVDTKQLDYQEQITKALKQSKQVVAYLSLCSGDRRQERVDYLFSQLVPLTLVIDEADFGAHQRKQSQPLIEARRPEDTVILMTGTNGDRAASNWDIDYYMGVVYPELLMNKHSDRLDENLSFNTLQHFHRDPMRDTLAVEIEFYQMNLIRAVNRAEDAGIIDDETLLPSWSKFAAAPVKGKGFFTRMLQAIFLGQHSLDELNSDYQFDPTGMNYQETRVAMMFLPASFRNDNLAVVKNMAQQALRGYTIVTVNGDTTSNAKAERMVVDEIDEARRQGNHVLIMSAGMAQRSFSVPEITELYLAYDEGEVGPTIQKMSRALTPSSRDDKVSRIVSLSFDPNRDDKFDSIILETAQNYKTKHSKRDMREAIKDVLRTIDIFQCGEDGSTPIEVDDYLEQCLQRKSLTRVIGKLTNLSNLSPEEIRALAEGNADYFRSEKKEAAKKGKTRKSKKNVSKSKGSKDVNAKTLAKAREVVTTIVENVDVILYGTCATNLYDALNTIATDQEMQEDVQAEFGVDFSIIQHLFDYNVINRSMVELLESYYLNR